MKAGASEDSLQEITLIDLVSRNAVFWCTFLVMSAPAPILLLSAHSQCSLALVFRDAVR